MSQERTTEGRIRRAAGALRTLMLHAVVGFILLGTSLSQVQANHRSGHVERPGRLFSNPFSQVTDPPSTRVEYTTRMDRLDHHVGQLYTQTLTLERGLGDKHSVSLGVPILTLDSNFRSTASGLGDLRLGFKATVLQRSNKSHVLTLGADVNLPTGDFEDGFGAKETSTNLFVNYIHTVRKTTLFASLGTTFSWQEVPRPSFSYTMGTSKSMVRKRLQFYLAVNGETLTSSGIYENNATRLFVIPGVGWSLTQQNLFTLNIGWQQRIHDGFKARPGSLVFLDSPVVVNDRTSSVIVNLTFGF